MKESTQDNLFMIFFLIIGIALGIIGMIGYDQFDNKRGVDGLYIVGTDDWSETVDYALDMDNLGDWVCVNVAYDMSPERANEVCIHECSHKAYSEIYAERCEANPEGCLEAKE